MCLAITYSVAVSSQVLNASAEREWRATLDLETGVREGVTRLTAAKHEGPLRVQRPFVQSDGSCHIYLLHPPGGLVGGDSLDISINATAGTHTVVTTPAAGKHYGCLPGMPTQSVRQRISVGDQAFMEWVPQESIFFNRTNADVHQRVDLQPSSRYLGWEIITFGRRAFGEDFSAGSMTQALDVCVAGQMIHRERLVFSELMQTSHWGLDGASVVGTLIAFNLSETKDDTERVRGALRDPNWGVTKKGRTLLVRFVGDSAEECREGFFKVRDQLSGSPRPRIWKT